MKSGLAFLGLLPGAVLGLAHKSPAGPIIQTSSGPVSGHAASINATVSEYLGIPYAKPPVGDLRWETPQKFNGTTPLSGSSFGPTCISPDLGGGSPYVNTTFLTVTSGAATIVTLTDESGLTFSEDCLYLNLWVPSGGERHKAVMVFFHGGAFLLGSSTLPLYNGQHLAADEDVIVVTINYRLSIFGFPGSPSLLDLNPGLMDQRAAVEWVHKNIDSFGGDANRITLFGQSAGSASIDLYSFAHPSNPLVNGFIQESGTAGVVGLPSVEAKAPYWYNVSQALGCGDNTTSDASVLSCMKSKDAFAIRSQLTTAQGFGPTVDNRTVYGDMAARAIAGNFAKKPLLLGNTNFEAGIWRALSPINLPDSYWAAFDDQNFNCPTASRANVSIAHHIPTWRYRYMADFPDVRLSQSPSSGAYHSSELYVLFATLPPTSATYPDWTAEELAFGKYFRGAWAAFAKDPKKGLVRYDNWPQYHPTGKTLIRLANNNQTGTNLAVGSLYDNSCNITYGVF